MATPCHERLHANLTSMCRGSQGDRSKAGFPLRPGYSTDFIQDAGSVLMRKRFKPSYFKLRVDLLA